MKSIFRMAYQIFGIVTFVFMVSCQTKQRQGNHSEVAASMTSTVALDPTSKPVVNSLKNETLVVLAGGFSSCPDDGLLDTAMRAAKTDQMYQLFWTKGIQRRIQQESGSAPVVLSICYTGPNSLRDNLAQSIAGRYAWNLGKLEKGSLGVTEFGIPQGSLLQDVNFLSHIKSELKEYLNRKKSENIEVSLYFIGHSYGGFTSIHLAEYFSENFAAMATIDPISMLDCQAKDMATKVYSTILMKLPGCRTAPGDQYSSKSSESVISNIKNSKGRRWWFHSYQNAFPWLQSGPIKVNSGSPTSTQMFTIYDFQSALIDGDYHSQMGRAEEVWDLISMQFRAHQH